MLKLDKYLKLDAEAIKSPNLCDKFSDEDLKRIGAYVVQGYKADKQSRRRWEERTEAAMKLAMQVQEEKSFPWPNASNIKFPLITIASMQFHARAYPALLPDSEPVKTKTYAEDPDGSKSARGYRVGCHMSYQLMEEDQPWEENHDRLCITLPIVGTAFKKSYYSNSKGHNVSELVLAQDLVLNYYAKSVEDCPRKTHVIPLFRNDIYERTRRGSFRDCLDEPWFKGPAQPQTNENRTNVDNRQGATPPTPDSTTPFTTLEQHCVLDLDDDGYEEPYIVTVEEGSVDVLRIVSRCENEADIEKNEDGKVIQIRGTEYFTKYPFIPSPDGGIYDVGFGILLGPLNESVNTLINQLVDAGTMATTAGGFLGRGVKVRGGNYSFSPLEWKRVDSTGDDLNKNIVPLPVREPSSVLLQLLTLLVDYTNRISASTDAMTGQNPGQNTPAYNQQSMIQEGMRIYTALFKRIWRAMKEEFRKLYVLNGLYLPPKSSYGSAGGWALREDYLGNPQDVTPSADPTAASDEKRIQTAVMVKQSAMQTPGYDTDAVERYFLDANKVEGRDVLFLGKDKVPPGVDPKVQIEQMKVQFGAMKIKQQHFEFVMKMSQEANKMDAEIENLKAQSALFLTQAGAEKAGAELKAFDAQIGLLQAHVEHQREMIKLSIEQQNADTSQQEAETNAKQAAQPASAA